MFNLNETITTFNRIYDTKIKSNKTWGLVYLQPKSLSFLNQYRQLIQQSVYYASPFVTDRKALCAALAGTKKQSLSESLPTLQNITQQLKTDQSILQRLNWEEHLSVRLNNKDFWEERFNQVDLHPRIQCYLMQLQTQWKKHQLFQYHSSPGLLFLLDVVIEYQHHFTQAHKELQKRQDTWLTFFRLPNAIAKGYSLFLADQLKYLKNLRAQILEALLLRLKIAEQQNQVACDDVSYFLAQEIQRLDSPSVASLSLPQHQRTLDTSTFTKVHRVIEKHGHANQKKQLYQLAWYEYAEFNSEEFTVITLSQQRLLLPKALLNFLPKKYRKFIGLFTNNTKHFKFLETQQALFAQLTLSLNLAQLPLESVSITHPTLRSLTTRYQLLQQSLQSVEKQPIRWWQWQQKRWRKAWQAWLVKQLQKNQASFSDCLTDFYQQVQSREDLLSQASYCEKVQSIIQAFQTLVDNNSHEHQNTSLTIILDRLSTLFQKKFEKNFSQVSPKTDSLLHSFKKDLLTILKDYIQLDHHPQGKRSENRHSDYHYLWSLLTTCNDMVQVREEFTHYNNATRLVLFKWIPALDPNVLRRRLKTILENPKYSMEQLKLAALSQSEKNKSQERIETITHTKPDTVISDANDSKPLTIEKEVDQLEKRIQRRIDNTSCSYSFFKELSENDVDNLNCFKSVRCIA